ncbi:MAG TPA: hypothetical protein VHD91_03595 [Gaiellaceae bacterium]|nr:hypothetical protein [Gaiellaceae bacterium]
MSDELMGHERLVSELRGAELEAPARLRARVLALETARRRLSWRPAAAVVAVALAGAAVGGGVSHSTQPSAARPSFGAAASTTRAKALPQATEVRPQVTEAPARRGGGWSTTDGALAGAGGGLVLAGLGVALVRLRRRPI